mmetsp:Transcript_39548/g.104795  ORF Transcript_39548/g.104795 Transcript_39548/m.104795 type:complete len:232 (+) Transcript_39548:162-857(+)
MAKAVESDHTRVPPKLLRACSQGLHRSQAWLFMDPCCNSGYQNRQVHGGNSGHLHVRVHRHEDHVERNEANERRIHLSQERVCEQESDPDRRERTEESHHRHQPCDERANGAECHLQETLHQVCHDAHVPGQPLCRLLRQRVAAAATSTVIDRINDAESEGEDPWCVDPEGLRTEVCTPTRSGSQNRLHNVVQISEYHRSRTARYNVSIDAFPPNLVLDQPHSNQKGCKIV